MPSQASTTTTSESLSSTPHGLAWVTAVTRGSYVVGAQALARSLLAARSRHPLLVMITPAISELACVTLSAEPNIHVIRVQPYEMPAAAESKDNYAFERFADCWTKLRAWELTGYTKLCWLDADMLVLSNMDEVFEELRTEADVFAAAPACLCNPDNISTYPKWWTPQACKFTHLEEACGSTCERGSSNAEATEGKVSPPMKYFNAGLILFRPSRDELARMEEYLRTEADVASYLFSEQDFLNEFYKSSCIELLYVYNSLKTLAVCHKELWDLGRIKNIHYILDKPWERDLTFHLNNTKSPYDTINQMWWFAFLGLINADAVAPWMAAPHLRSTSTAGLILDKGHKTTAGVVSGANHFRGGVAVYGYSMGCNA